MGGDHDSGLTANAAPPPPLSIPVFRLFWFANITANFGSLIQGVGAAWLMTSLTTSPVMVALVQSSTTFPIMMLSLLSGAIADNLDRRKIMIAAQIFMLIASIGLVICAWLNLLTPWLLLAFTFLIGCGVASNTPAQSASVGDMVPRSVVPAAVGLNSMGFNIARSIGPAIGGLIVASVGAVYAFVANVFSNVMLIAFLIQWRPNYPAKHLPRESLLAAMHAGPRYVMMSPNLRVVMVRSTLFGIFASAAPTLMPLIARDVIHGGAGVFGLLSAGFGVGAVGGALVTAQLRTRLSSEKIVQLAALFMAAGTALAGVSTFTPLTLLAVMLAGSGWVLGLSTFNILVQMASPRWVVGRALACYQMCAFGAMSIGAWIIGGLTESLGVVMTLIVLAAIQASNVLWGFILPVADADALNLDPLRHSYEPKTQVPVPPRSGPIVIDIAYRIAPSDVPAFQEAMLECRRIRRRDGAMGWSLVRDLGDEERWVERYQAPTWISYLRHIGRRTHDDAANWDRIEKLHIGPEPPVVTRMLERQPGRVTADEPSDPLPNPAGLV
jgi:MFS family permease